MSRSPVGAVLFALALVPAPPAPAAPSIQRSLADVLAELDGSRVPSGILYDRVLPVSRIAAHDGGPAAPPATLAEFRQMASEIHRASLRAPAWSLADLRRASRDAARRGTIPVALLGYAYERLREDALQDGSLVRRGGRLVPGERDPLRRQTVFAAAPGIDHTYRGERVTFAFDPELVWTDTDHAPREISFDPGDGRGFRAVRPGGTVGATYDRVGRRTAHLRVTTDGGEILHAAFAFDVLRLGLPAPDDTLSITATVPYQGQFGTGDAYVYLAPGRTQIENPVIVLEGFDLDNSMNWEELYELLNQQSLLESLRALGFDAVVLNFGNATAPIQENAFVALELVQEVRAIVGPPADLVLVGASMGGLCAQYGLAWAESHGIEHDVRTLVQFDVPHAGAVVPLGIQYWVSFFAEQSADAAALLGALDSPAARQMLVHHHTDPPGSTGEPDPLRADFLADLEAVGGWPTRPRLAAVSNGSGSQADQGFAPGAQLILYEYESLLVDVTGNVWAVPDGGSQTVFDGRIAIILLPPEALTVTVSGTLPWDGAPGGFRGSMAQMDTTQAPYGDIVALHDNHCFVPTISALALDHTTDPFHDVAGDPDLPAHTPFDAVLWQPANEEHVFVSPATAQWLIDELVQAVTGVHEEPGPRRPPTLSPGTPNPFLTATRLSFTLGTPAPVSLSVYDVQGRLVARLLEDDPRSAGRHALTWTPESGTGVYFVRLETPRGAATRKVLRIRE